MFYNIFSYITHLIHDETLFNFKYHVRNEGLIFFIHLHSAPCDFIFALPSSRSLSLLFSFSLSVSICLFVYLSICTNLHIYIYIHICISTLVSVSKRSFITRTKQKQIRPVSDVYNVRQTSEKKHSLSIDRILRSTDDSRKFFSPVLCKKKNGGCLAYAFPGSRDFIINWKLEMWRYRKYSNSIIRWIIGPSGSKLFFPRIHRSCASTMLSKHVLNNVDR